METTETILDNCVLLTPQEAAELWSNEGKPVYVAHGGKVHCRQLFDAVIIPIIGTVLSIVGIEDGSRYLCIFSDEKEEFLRLRDQLLERLRDQRLNMIKGWVEA